MGAVNCPETPRQKMVGIMYLVLTAMLALNVSSSVLDAFSKVQSGLTQTVDNYSKMSEQIYAEFDNAYALNENKVKPWRDKALEVKKRSEKLCNDLEDIKWEVCEAADGEDADVNNIKSKDNLDVGGQVMILEGGADKLKEKIDAYRKYVLSLVSDKNPTLCKTLEINLTTKDPEPVGGEHKTWGSDNFEHMPLAAVTTVITKMQVDVRNAESDVISHLYKNIDEGSFKFNSISAHVVPSSNYILQGDTYKAKILLAAIDTTQRPTVEINGQTVKTFQGDATLYSVACGKTGTFKWKGVVKYVMPTGEVKHYPIEDEYIVAAPSVVVSPLKMNVFYVGVDNPVNISVAGIASSKVVPTVSNGSIVRLNGNYVVRPKYPRKPCDVNVSIKTSKGLRKMQTLHFRVKTVPNPIARVAGKSGGNISKSSFAGYWGVKAELDDFDFDMKFNVKSFNLSTVDGGGYVKEAESAGQRFSSSQKKIISKLKRGQRVIIDNIKAKGPDGKVRTLQSLSFKIN